MSHWEESGKSSDWYTPKYIFDALDIHFDLDVSHPGESEHCHVPCTNTITSDSLSKLWSGTIWMNPPFGGRNGLVPWLDKFFEHNDGIALTPDRTSTEWWQDAAKQADAILFIEGKIQFIKPDGTLGKSPSTGTTLFGCGYKAVKALKRASENKLGILWLKY